MRDFQREPCNVVRLRGQIGPLERTQLHGQHFHRGQNALQGLADFVNDARVEHGQ